VAGEGGAHGKRKKVSTQGFYCSLICPVRINSQTNADPGWRAGGDVGICRPPWLNSRNMRFPCWCACILYIWYRLSRPTTPALPRRLDCPSTIKMTTRGRSSHLKEWRVVRLRGGSRRWRRRPK